VPAVQATTLLLLEPVLNPLWTWLLEGERVSLATIAGGALIVGSIFGSTLYEARMAQ
jgi:drug/metabolite transporter (DMT)-like permease